MSASPLKKILLVDDSRFMLEIMGKAFKNQGFTCFKAESVEQGLQILKGVVPDIILSDYEMPKLNGFDFRKLLIDSPQLKNIPFVFLTSHTDKKTMMKGLDLQAVDYINKNAISLNDIKLFIGYCGGDAGELEAEIEEGSWVILNKDIDIVFTYATKNLWD